jgi:hypothetical protein
VQRASRYDLARALAPRYVHAGKRERGAILDEFCAVTGYTRKYALTLLRCPPPAGPPRDRRGRPPRYGPAEVTLLRRCWELTDGICGKRLAPFLPELLARLRARRALRDVPLAVQARVAQMSAATVDRVLAPYRRLGPWPARGRSLTKPGSVLKHQVALKTFADWEEAQPGFCEVDLVAHCGWSGAGAFLYTLSLVDVATGWVACAGLADKRQATVLRALGRLREQLPFPLRGLDADNGSEFMNRDLLTYCAAAGIVFTRARPYRKNDNCHVEQKNWAVVRRLVGYARLEWRALPALERVHDLARDYVNFLHPVRKLVSKTRHGASVPRRYDAAQTPYRRLLASGSLSSEAVAALEARSAALDPLQLKWDLEAAQRILAARAVRAAPAPPPTRALRSDAL